MITKAARKRTPHSGTSSAVMRERRIRSTAIPELRVALEAGLVTTYRAGEIAKLSADQQKVAVAQWAARHQYRTQGQAIAAKAILQALKRRRGKVDLGMVAAAIRAAIAQRSLGSVAKGHPGAAAPANGGCWPARPPSRVAHPDVPSVSE